MRWSVATLVAAALAVAAVTLIMTDGERSDWVSAAVVVGAIAFGMIVRWALWERRRERR